jgi:calcium-dependent protein kinase
MTKNEKENLAKIFKEIDKNGDGKLSKEEILDEYDKFYGKTINKEDVLKIFDSVDIDKSGFIEYSEFLEASINEKQLLTDEKLLSAFKKFDKDGSGTIQAQEIKEILAYGKTVSEEVVNEIVK